MNDNRTRQPLERLIVVVAVALLLFVTPVFYIWARDDSSWYSVYVLWLFVIGLSAWLYFTQRDDDV